jgi:hypothetical protein
MVPMEIHPLKETFSSCSAGVTSRFTFAPEVYFFETLSASGTTNTVPLTVSDGK